MKKIILRAAMLAVIFTQASCKKEMMGYEGMEGVYFAMTSGPNTVSSASWPYRPSSTIEFVKQPASVQQLVTNIKVMITGPVKDFDRIFKVALNPDSTTAQVGVHYEAFANTFTIPANAIVGYIPVTVKRTPDMLTGSKAIGLRLVANENFGLSFPAWKAIPGLGDTYVGKDSSFDASLHTIYVNDVMVQPAVWRGSVVAATNKETGSWGAFTRKKLELICQLFNLTYQDFSSELTMTPVLVSLITQEMTRYLINQFNAGNLIKEDDGRLMWMGSVPWTSIVGVPY